MSESKSIQALRKPRRPLATAGVIVATVIALSGVGAGAWALGSAVIAQPQDQQVQVSDDVATPTPTVTETPTPTPTPTPTEEPVVEQPAPPPAAPAPSCPAGSFVAEMQGGVVTYCMWNVCTTLTLPDPDHPECDQAFRP